MPQGKADLYKYMKYYLSGGFTPLLGKNRDHEIHNSVPLSKKLFHRNFSKNWLSFIEEVKNISKLMMHDRQTRRALGHLSDLINHECKWTYYTITKLKQTCTCQTEINSNQNSPNGTDTPCRTHWMVGSGEFVLIENKWFLRYTLENDNITPISKWKKKIQNLMLKNLNQNRRCTTSCKIYTKF